MEYNYHLTLSLSFSPPSCQYSEADEPLTREEIEYAFKSGPKQVNTVSAAWPGWGGDAAIYMILFLYLNSPFWNKCEWVLAWCWRF